MMTVMHSPSLANPAANIGCAAGFPVPSRADGALVDVLERLNDKPQIGSRRDRWLCITVIMGASFYARSLHEVNRKSA